jgi:hypothetical protein
MVKELRPLCPNAVQAGWPVNLMKVYNRQNSLASLTSGFQSLTHLYAPTAWQHEANGKRYSSWADVEHGFKNQSPLSMVVLGTGTLWECHILVHMFRVTYTRRILISHTMPVIDDCGFVFHTITLASDTQVYNTAIPVWSFDLLLPIQNKDGNNRYCLLDKDWRFVGRHRKWTVLD